MMGGWIVPIHQERGIVGIEIVFHQSGGIGLLVDQRDGGANAQQRAIDLIADPEIFGRHPRRYQGPDHLAVAGTDQFDLVLGQ